MNKDSPVKPSVVELAGRFKGHVIPTPTAHDELHNMKHDHGELEKPSIVSPQPPKVKLKTSKSSPLIEKLQVSVSLPLSPTLRPQLSSEEEEPADPVKKTLHCTINYSGDP
ncbi:unnamed protein product [Coregonus sp. 'balchen']|nr:unnamed protein product [Coregonus sp. 'balchen']